MKCYQCGKREAAIEGLCEPCFLEGQPPLFLKDLKIPVCKECGAFYFGVWKDNPLAEIVEEYIGLENSDFIIREHGQNFIVSVVARQKFHKNQTVPLVQQTEFSVYTKESLCDQCSKMLSGYYQAVLQVRRQDHFLTERERKLVLDIVTTSLKKKDFISRIEERKEGTNFYFSTAKAAKRTADILKRRLGGIIRESYHTVGFNRQKSTETKRGTILFSLYRYKKGDIVFCQDSIYEVRSAHRKLHLKNAEEEKVIPWKKVEFLENQNQISVLPLSSYDIYECQVIDVNPSSVMVMLPNFDTVYLKRPKDIKVGIGNRYRILFFQEHTCWM
jgi:nonsense-mediated mRNA decay protein 3